VAAHEDVEVAQDDVVAVLECDGFVADTGAFRARELVGFAATEAFSIDQSWTVDRDVFEAFAVDETVRPMIVTEVLETLPWLCRSGGVIAAGGGALLRNRRRKDRRSSVQLQRYMA
jgi:hypothetical protein